MEFVKGPEGFLCVKTYEIYVVDDFGDMVLVQYHLPPTWHNWEI
jgi:hypothetical protein